GQLHLGAGADRGRRAARILGNLSAHPTTARLPGGARPGHHDDRHAHRVVRGIDASRTQAGAEREALVGDPAAIAAGLSVIAALRPSADLKRWPPASARFFRLM